MEKKKTYVKPLSKVVLVETSAFIASSPGATVDDGNKKPVTTEGNPDEIDAAGNTDLWVEEDEE